MADLRQIVVDSRHPAALARFWEAALDAFEIRAYDEAEIARLAASGRTPETDPCVILAGPTLEICFQEMDVPQMSKKPMHLDVASLNRVEETARLVALGASIVEVFDAHTCMRERSEERRVGKEGRSHGKTRVSRGRLK